MPGQIKIGSYNTKLLEWQKHRFAYLLLPHRLPHNFEARNNDSILFKFCHREEGLAEWIVLDGRGASGSPGAGICFQVVWFLGSHVSSPLAASAAKASPWGASSSSLVLLVQSLLSVPAAFLQTGEKLLDHSLPASDWNRFTLSDALGQGGQRVPQIPGGNSRNGLWIKIREQRIRHSNMHLSLRRDNSSI